jgi:nitrogen fixation/metabolism regulation signal transduction histidine kinase
VVVFTVIRDPSQLAIKLVFKSFVYFSPAIIASVLLLPLFIHDILKTSHKVAGPIHRLRNEMTKVTEGKEIKTLRFRDGDHWTELAEDFNEMAAALMAERKAREEAESKLKDLEPVSV